MLFKKITSLQSLIHQINIKVNHTKFRLDRKI